MKENVVKDKSYQFALMVVDLSKYLSKGNEFVLSRQLLRSGTSIGANVEEALAGQSRADFLSKMSIASKEAREANYWLRLLRDSNTCDESRLRPVLLESEGLINILSSIVKTTSARSASTIHNSKLRIQNKP